MAKLISLCVKLKVSMNVCMWFEHHASLINVLFFYTGADIWDIVHRAVPHNLHSKDQDAWLDVAESLKLTDEQKCQVMVSRYMSCPALFCPALRCPVLS